MTRSLLEKDVCRLVTRHGTNKNFLKLRIFFLSYSIYEHDTINIADSSSIRDASLCGLVVEHRSAKTEGLRFHSSLGLRIFSLSHARDKTKKHLLLFSYRAQNLQSFLFYLDPICDEKYVPLWCCSIELLSHIWKFLIVFF